jgi:hypothetical protein
MGKLLLLLLFFLFAMMAMAVALYAWFGWPGLLLAFLAVVLFALVVRLTAGRILQALFLAPFKAKGAVLRGADGQVHSVLPAAAPELDESLERTEDMTDEEWDEIQAEQEEQRQERKNARFYQVEVTITPREPQPGGFTMWEPGDLSLASPGAQGGSMDDDDDFDAWIENVQIYEDGAWRDDEGLKYHGPQRLRLLVGMPRNLTGARFRYYLEVFGDLDLTAPLPG